MINRAIFLIIISLLHVKCIIGQNNISVMKSNNEIVGDWMVDSMINVFGGSVSFKKEQEPIIDYFKKRLKKVVINKDKNIWTIMFIESPSDYFSNSDSVNVVENIFTGELFGLNNFHNDYIHIKLCSVIKKTNNSYFDMVFNFYDYKKKFVIIHNEYQILEDRVIPFDAYKEGFKIQDFKKVKGEGRTIYTVSIFISLFLIPHNVFFQNDDLYNYRVGYLQFFLKK